MVRVSVHMEEGVSESETDAAEIIIGAGPDAGTLTIQAGEACIQFDSVADLAQALADATGSPMP